jgi:hypothetical protein
MRCDIDIDAISMRAQTTGAPHRTAPRKTTDRRRRPSTVDVKRRST